MPEEEAGGPKPLPAEQVADEAVFAAEQTRKTSAWLASALGAIPSLAIVGALVRAPGDYGFDDDELKLGIALAAAGAVVGILAFARVMAPLKLTNKSLQKFEVDRLPGHHFTSTAELLEEIDLLKSAVRHERLDAAESRREAEDAKAAAAEAEKDAIEAEAAAKAAPADAAKQAQAVDKRRIADTKKQETDSAVAHAAEQAITPQIWDNEIRARERLRADALRLTAADTVGRRYFWARVIAVLSVALVAAGIYYLALAPIEKTQTSTQTSDLTLVDWTPTAEGKVVLGCDVASIRGLQVSGDDKALQVVTLPTDECPDPKLIGFPEETETPLGPVTKVKVITAEGE